MRQSIRFLSMLLLALSLSTGAMGSASAQTTNPWGIDPADPGPIRAQGVAGGEVTKTFELTLTGDVPEGEIAFVIYETSDGGEDFIDFCGPAEFATEGPCEAGTYTSDPITLDAGTQVSYVFLAGDPEAQGPRFEEEGMETLTESMVNRAAFDYGGGDKQDDTQVDNEQKDDTPVTDEQKDDTGVDEGKVDAPVIDEQKDDAPTVDEQKDDTQAGEGKDDGGDTLPVTGGAAPAGVPLGGVAALGLLLTSGYAALRRR